MTMPLSLLMLEDSEDDALIVLRELKRGGYEVSHQRVQSAATMRAALNSRRWDIILSDYAMPGFSAPEALKIVQQTRLDIPFIIVSGTVGEDIAVEAMKAGANDFFTKDKLIRLVPAVEREIRDARERRIRQQTEQQLYQSEERFAKIFQTSPIGISITTFPEGRYIDINDRYCELFGYTREEIIGSTSVKLGIWASLSDREQVADLLKQQHRVNNSESTFYTKNREERHCLVSYEQIILDEELCVVSMIADNTERKAFEKALERNNALIKLLQEVSVAANEANDVESALQFAIQRVCGFTGWDIGHVYLLPRKENPEIVSSVWHTESPERFEKFRAVSNRMRFTENNQSLIYRVISAERAEWTGDVGKKLGPVRAQLAESSGIKAAYAFPVITQQQVSAVLEFFSTREIEPDQALLSTIANIATQVGRVIERTQSSTELNALYNATSYLFSADSLQDLAQQIVSSVVTEFQQVDCGLLLIDKQTGALLRAARTGENRTMPGTVLLLDGPGLVPKAIRESRLLYAPDVELEPDYMPSVESTRSELIVPLKTTKTLLGVLDLQSTEIDNFTLSDQRILSAFAERAAAAIEIMQLVEEINQYANQLEHRVVERTHELNRAKERAEAILNNSSDAIILTDAVGKIQQTNHSFNTQLGYDVDELFGCELTTILAPESGDRFTTVLSDVTSNKQSRRMEIVVHRKDGTQLPVDIALSSFAEKEQTGLVFSLRDITEQKQLEYELREAFQRQKELIELKTRFVSMVSHEYRTPLAAIMTSSTILQDYNDRLTDERRKAHFSTIQTQVHRLTDLLEQVLQINKAESVGLELNREIIDIVAFCRELVENMHQLNGQRRIEFIVLGQPVLVNADMKLIRQIINNLMSNALKYSPAEGTIWVTLSFEAEQLLLEVQDEGIGIPKEDQEQLFTMYHRAKNVGDIQGTGLGLVIIKQAVEAHEGTISVESQVGKGTTFQIALPLRNGELGGE